MDKPYGHLSRCREKKTFNLNLTLIHDQITTQQTNKKKEHSEFNKRHK